MPTLYPSPLPDFIRRDPRRAAEVRVYDALAAGLGEGWCVFHSVAWLGKGRDESARDGEADFVLAHPERGLLVLEVKGGEIIYDAPTGRWASRDAQGEVHDIADPFAQAVAGKHALLRQLKELPVLRDRWLLMAHGVCFPSAAKGKWALGPAAPPEIVVDHDDLAAVGAAVERIFDHFAGQGHWDPLGSAGMDAVRRLLARSFELRLTLGTAARSEEAEMLRLTEEQFGVLAGLARVRRAAVHGGAGTGKTLLALEKARRLAGAGFRTLLTCYNLPLESHLRAAAGDVPGLTIRSFHPLCYDAARAQGLDVPPMDRDARTSDYWEYELPEALLQALERGMEPFDALVVDEGQDFSETWWMPLGQCLGDPDGGVLYVFLDAHQGLYGRDAAFVEGLTPFVLTANLRNTQAIHTLAQPFYGGDTLRPAGPTGRPPQVVPVKDGASLEQALAPVLRELTGPAGLRPQDVAVLTGRRPERFGLARDRVGGLPAVDAEHLQTGHVVLDTIYRFKGLDSAAVVLTGLDGIPQATAGTLLYVGITRARSHLVIVERPEVLVRWGLGGA